MNNIALKTPQTGLAAVLQNEWLDYGKSLSARPYIGDFVLFKKGDYTRGTGDQQMYLEPGTPVIGIVPGAQVGWQNFSGGTPGEHIFVPATQRLQLPTRRALGDTDSALWEIGEDGRAKDPWQYMRNMALVIDDEVCTFSTSSSGGKGFIADLVTEYGRALARGVVGKLPKIELTFGSYQHKNRTYGRIKIPTFKILGWVDEAKYLALLSGAGDSGPGAPELIVSDDPGLPEKRTDADRATEVVDEEIPF